MIITKKDATEFLSIYRELFTRAGIMNNPCTIKFDMHTSSDFIVTDIKQKSIGELKNKPNKMVYEGKNRSPMLFEIVNNQAPIYFTFDDTTIVALGNGVRITVALDTPLNGKDYIEVDIRR